MTSWTCPGHRQQDPAASRTARPRPPHGDRRRVHHAARCGGGSTLVHSRPGSNSFNGDGARLVQVFANVLHNAVKFTPRGGHIWFTTRPAVPRGGRAHPRYGCGNCPRRPPAGVRHVPPSGTGARSHQRWLGHRADIGAAAGGDARRGDRHSKFWAGPGSRGRNSSADRSGGSHRGRRPNGRPSPRGAPFAC